MIRTGENLARFIADRLQSALSRALVISAGLTAVACARGKTAAVGPHRPEPVTPPMSVAEPVAVPPAVVRTPPTLGATVRHIADSATASPMWRTARWGLLVVDVTSGDTLISHDADRMFMPASNEKLLTAAVAMQQLGPDYRWRTPVMLRGRQRGDTWYGDLLVSGSGDPSFSDTMRGGVAASAFDTVVTALKARGIKRVVGNVAAFGDAFTGATTGFGWQADDFDLSYSAAVDELMFNEGELNVRVFGGAKFGAPVRVVRMPTSSYPPLSVKVETRAPASRADRLQAEYDSVGVTLQLTGAVAVGDSASVTVAYRHPSDAFRAALRERLIAGGVRVVDAPVRKLTRRQQAKADSVSALAPSDTVVVLVSPPLREVLPKMQKPSQNQIAELLFRTSGLVASGSGSADSARAVGARTLAGFGVGADEIAYRDGSGLSRHDYLTPRAVVKVLDAMRLSPWFDLYRDALPLAGVDGTIANRMKGTPAAGNAHAKTGTVDKARSLSGYVTTADGHLVLFSMLCNNYTVPNREIERVQDLLVVTIAASRVGSGGDARDR